MTKIFKKLSGVQHQVWSPSRRTEHMPPHEPCTWCTLVCVSCILLCILLQLCSLVGAFSWFDFIRLGGPQGPGLIPRGIESHNWRTVQVIFLLCIYPGICVLKMMPTFFNLNMQTFYLLFQVCFFFLNLTIRT